MDALASLAHMPARPAGQIFAAWMRGAWRLFRLAPLAILALSLLPILVEAALQLLPGIGIVLSKLLTPPASAWVLVMIDSRARAGAFAPRRATRRWWTRLPQIALAAVLLGAVFAFQMLTAALIGGSDQAMAFALGDIERLTLSRAEVAAVLASGVIPGSLVIFVVPRVVLDGNGVGPAIIESLSLVVRYWRPVAMYAALSAALIASLLWVPLLLLVFLPLAGCAGYAMYRDVFDPTPVACA